MNDRSERPPGRTDARGPRFDPVPKPGGGTRWLTLLDPAGDAEYRRAVVPLAGRIERSLGPEVLAIRTTPSPDGWRVAPWSPAREAWRRALLEAVSRGSRGTAFGVTDVRDCYGSISAETITTVLGPEAAHAARILRRLGERGVRGLPVGPEPSVVLANGVLAWLDEALRTAGVRHLRWVDDFAFWGPAANVRRAISALRVTAASLRIDLHDRKTTVISAADDVRALLLARRPSGAARERPGIITAP